MESDLQIWLLPQIWRSDPINMGADLQTCPRPDWAWLNWSLRANLAEKTNFDHFSIFTPKPYGFSSKNLAKCSTWIFEGLWALKFGR